MQPLGANGPDVPMERRPHLIRQAPLIPLPLDHRAQGSCAHGRRPFGLHASRFGCSHEGCFAPSLRTLCHDEGVLLPNVPGAID
jgi:hypothetical protein